MIEGQVAQILGTRELVLNRGRLHGVAPGMKFEVLEPKGQDVIDPETHEAIGSIQRSKIRVQAVTVEERMTIAKTYRYHRVNVGGHGAVYPSSVLDALTPPRYVNRYETFKTDDAAWEPLSESESWVKVGDPFRELVLDDDAEDAGAAGSSASSVQG